MKHLTDLTQLNLVLREGSYATLWLNCRCALTALSMNTSQRRQPSIWGASGLPSDAYQLSAAPRGGALVLCQNLLLYHTQVRSQKRYSIITF